LQLIAKVAVREPCAWAEGGRVGEAGEPPRDELDLLDAAKALHSTSSQGHMMRLVHHPRRVTAGLPCVTQFKSRRAEACGHSTRGKQREKLAKMQCWLRWQQKVS
jgi:hypothetical protein